ncbi:MAG: hydrogenase maturation peptidase HycI [Candidatus Eisenbacteria bacterium]
MPDLRKILQKSLSGAERIALLAVGSDLRGDDAAGLLVAESLEQLRGRHGRTSRFRIFLGETAPENLTGAIREFAPTHIIVIDSADAGKKAGTIFAIDPKEVGGISFSTHQLPLSLMIQYLQESITCSVSIIGIQPKSLGFGAPVSQEIRKAVAQVAADMDAVIQQILGGKPTRTKKPARKRGPART